MNGSEFLLFAGWRTLVTEFEKNGTLLSLATNGMLLDRSASQLLVSTRILRDINFSMDGASKHVVETVRPGIHYETLLANIETFISVLAQERYRLTVSLSMVLLRNNFHEAEALVELANRLRDDRPVDIHVSYQLLNAGHQSDYAKFYSENRVDLKLPEVAESLERAAGAGERHGIETRYCYHDTLRRAVQSVDTAGSIRNDR